MFNRTHEIYIYFFHISCGTHLLTDNNFKKILETKYYLKPDIKILEKVEQLNESQQVYYHNIIIFITI